MILLQLFAPLIFTVYQGSKWPRIFSSLSALKVGPKIRPAEDLDREEDLTFEMGYRIRMDFVVAWFGEI